MTRYTTWRAEPRLNTLGSLSNVKNATPPRGRLTWTIDTLNNIDPKNGDLGYF